VNGVYCTEGIRGRKKDATIHFSSGERGEERGGGGSIISIYRWGRKGCNEDFFNRPG